MEQEIEVLKKINDYIKGKLSVDETDKLWIEFLKKSEYVEWLQVELNLKLTIDSNQ